MCLSRDAHVIEKRSWPNFQEIVRQGNFHEKSVLPKLTALYEPAIWLNTENRFLPKITTWPTRWRLKQSGKYHCPTIRLLLKIPKMACNSGTSLSTINRKRRQIYSATNHNYQPIPRCKEDILFQKCSDNHHISAIVFYHHQISNQRWYQHRRCKFDESTNRRRDVAEFAMNFAKDTIATHNYSRIPDKCWLSTQVVD